MCFLFVCSHSTERTRWDHPLFVKITEDLGKLFLHQSFQFSYIYHSVVGSHAYLLSCVAVFHV